MDETAAAGERHHAYYILERGVWRATCRLCGHTITDPGRRRAAALFRNHIRDATTLIGRDVVVEENGAVAERVQL
jgi:hypothetical protein